MLSARMVFVLVAVLGIATVAGMILDAVGVPDGAEQGVNSWGTRSHGHKAVVEVMQRLDLPVRRSRQTPDSILSDDTFLVLWKPFPVLMEKDKGYVEQIAAWVEQGGRLLLCIETTAEADPLLQDLGLGKVMLPQAQRKPPEDIWADLAGSVPSPTELHRVDGTGTLDETGRAVERVRLGSPPNEIITAVGPDPVGVLTVQATKQGRPIPVAAEYRSGMGRVLLVVEPSLVTNRHLAEADNAAMAVRLLHEPGHTTVFDEFFHGLNVRGNPMYLATVHPFGALGALLVLLTVVWAWREGVRLGPPLMQKQVDRRGVAEYVEAAARLFHRGNGHAWLLQQLRDGVLWAVQARLHLARKGGDPSQEVLAVLERRDQAAAAALRTALDHVDQLLTTRHRRINEKAFVAAGQGLLTCLWRISSRGSASRSGA